MKENRNRLAAFAWVAVAFLLLSLPAQAASVPAVTLQLDKSEVELGERAALNVTITGPRGTSDPVIPEVDGVDIVYQGRTHNMQIINMNVRSSTIFRYAVLPHEPGEFTIGPARVERAGETYESNAVTLSVVEARQAPISAGQSRSVIVEASVDNSAPYIGQQVTLLLRLARRTDAHIRNAGYSLPDLSDFWTEGLESKREYAQAIHGQKYLVTEVALPLFPITEGEVTIDRVTFHYEELAPSKRSPLEPPSLNPPLGRNFFDEDFFKFFRSEDIVKRTAFTDPLRLSVRPLPREGRPKDFTAGVGSFSMTARMSEDKVKVGESVTLTLSLSGEGNVRDLPDPELGIDGVKIYSDNPSTSVKNYHDTVVGEKVYKIALVPQRSGEITIPKLRVPYFNPESERYETASSDPLRLKALPSEKETLVMARPGRDKEERVGPEKRDILPIHERIGPLRQSRLGLWVRRLRLVAYPLPVLLYAVCLGIVKHRERLRTDTAYRRSRYAGKTAESHIRTAREALKGKRWGEVFAQCSRAVTEYLADKLDVPAAGLTAADVQSALSSRHVPENLSREIVNFLEGCDYGRFASSTDNPRSAAHCVERARSLIERLEREEALR